MIIDGPFNPYRVTEMRHMRGFSTAQLAEAMRKQGQPVTERDVRNWEQGAAKPTPDEQHYLTWVLTFPVARLFMAGGREIRVEMTTLMAHTNTRPEELCRCGHFAEFLCDERGARRQFVCSRPLCVVHAMMGDDDADYCADHILRHVGQGVLF